MDLDIGDVVTMNLVAKITGVSQDGKSADFDLRYTGVRMDIETGPDAGQGRDNPDVTVQATFTDRDQLTKVTSSTEAGAARQFLGGQDVLSYFPVGLPDHPVSIGDTWEAEAPLSGVPDDKRPKVKMKLAGEKTLDGVECWEITCDEDFSIQADT